MQLQSTLLATTRFASVERIRDYSNWNSRNLPSHDQMVVDTIATSTSQNPVRVVDTYAGDIVGGYTKGTIYCVPQGLNRFKVTGKKDLNRLDKILNRQDKASQAEESKPVEQRDYTTRNAHARSAIQFLFNKAGLPLPKLDAKVFSGIEELSAGYGDTHRSAQEHFKNSQGRDWQPYQPQR